MTLFDPFNNIDSEQHFEDFESTDPFDEYHILTREKLLRSLDETWKDVLIPCKVYLKNSEPEPWYDNGYVYTPGEPYIRYWHRDAFFTGDGYIVFPEPDWADWVRKPAPRKIIDCKAYYSPAAVGYDTDYALGAFEAKDKWGFFDFHSGEVVLGPQFGFCDSFTYYSESVRFNMLRGYLSPDADFDENVFPNHKDIPNGRWGHIEYNYSEILAIPPIYQYLSCWHNGVIVAKQDNRWGLIDYCGDPVTAFEWDDMWLDWNYGAIGKKKTPNGAEYTILDSQGIPLISGLPGFPHLLPVGDEGEENDDEDKTGVYTARYFKSGDRYGVIDCFGSFEKPEKARVVLAAEPTLTFKEAMRLIWDLEK